MTEVTRFPIVETESLPKVCAAVRCYNDVEKGQRYCASCQEKKDEALSKDLSKFSGYVYFVQPAPIYQGGPQRQVKIGYTRNYDNKRIKALQTGSSEKLHVLGKIGGGRWLEKKLHSVMKHHRGLGEWFEYNSVIGALVGGIRGRIGPEDNGFMRCALSEKDFEIWSKAMDRLMWIYSDLEEE